MAFNDVEDIVLGESNESKKSVLEKNIGREVLLKDAGRQAWFYGTLSRKGSDKENYLLQLKDGNEKVQISYYNIECLLATVSSKHSDYRHKTKV